MADSLGVAGHLIVSSAPIPASAVDALADRFAPSLAENRHLSATQRIAWLTSRSTDAGTAQSLCAAEFTNDQILEVLDVEKRTSCVQALAWRNMRPDALELIVGHPNGAAAAHLLIGRSGHDQVELLEHFGSFSQLDQVKLLLNCDRSVDDASIAEHLARVSDARPRKSSTAGDLDEMLDALVLYRPGLTAELAKLGHLLIAAAAVAASPWITEADVETLLSAEMGSATRDMVELAAVTNLWVDPHGVIVDRLDPSSVYARRVLADRGHVHLAGSPSSLGEEAVGTVWDDTFQSSVKRYRLQLRVLLARHPYLGPHARSTAELLHSVRTCPRLVPRWALDEIVAEFAANHPGHLSVPPRDGAASGTDLGLPYIGPADPEASVDVYENRHLLALRVESTWPRRDALARFAEALGGDPDRWVVAVTLADGFNGSLADLAGVVATVTGDSPTSAAA